MKKSQRRGNEKETGQPRPSAPPPSQWPRRLLAIVLLLVAAGTTWAVFEFVVWARVPNALVGKWVVEGGEQDGATFDFFRDGTMRGSVNVQGKQGFIEARVKVDGDTLTTTTRHRATGQIATRTQTIKLLTSAALVLEDDRGQVFRMTRAD